MPKSDDNDPSKQRKFTATEMKWRRGHSKWCRAEGSAIHQTGVFATRNVPEGTKIIEYVGEILTNSEADQRGIELANEVEGTDDAAVFNFILDDDYQIDGNKEYNTARFINHSCDPNCWVDIEEKRIWIIALKDIAGGEELTFDYGFDVEHWKEHPCRCGSDNCVGYIVSEEQWPQLKKKLKKLKKKKKKKKQKRKKKEKKRQKKASK